jgi:AcrR family transcriptional regulator
MTDASEPTDDLPAVASAGAVAESQRTRLMDAMQALCHEVTYANVKIGDVTARARVAKRTFYVHFVDKEDCFLAVYERVEAQMFETIAQAAAAHEGPRERIEHAIAALLGAMTDDPSAAHIFVLESSAVGPRASARRMLTLHRFADLYIALHAVVMERYPTPTPMSRIRAFAVVGAIEMPIATILREDGADALPAIASEISEAVYTLVYSPPLESVE